MPDWLAEVCILSRACASCSLSTCEEIDIEVVESRRERRSTGEDNAVGERAARGPSPLAMSSTVVDGRDVVRLQEVLVTVDGLSRELQSRSSAGAGWAWLG